MIIFIFDIIKIILEIFGLKEHIVAKIMKIIGSVDLVEEKLKLFYSLY